MQMTDNLHKRNLISSSNKYYEDINLFRGFAIFTIVWEHFFDNGKIFRRRLGIKLVGIGRL